MSRLPKLYDLYEAAVQEPEFELRLFERIFRSRYGHAPKLLREDFCASFLLATTWVKSGRDRRAIAVDLSKEALAAGRLRHYATLDESQQQRLTLVQGNVLDIKTEPVDVIIATNFSVCFLKERSLLVRYFKRVRAALKKKSVFIMDLMGGTDAELADYQYKWVMHEPSGLRFKYIWRQTYFNAITRDTRYAIDFDIPNVRRIKNAFTYDWRLWTIPELRDAMKEAGFSQVDVYWEGDDKKGGGNGIFRKATFGENCQSWICYIAAS